MGLDWTALPLHLVWISVSFCVPDSQAQFALYHQKDLKLVLLALCWLLGVKNNLSTCWKQGITNLVAFVPYLWAAGPPGRCLCNSDFGGCFTLCHFAVVWGSNVLTLFGLRVELSRPAHSSVALEVVHQLSDYFFPFNLTFLTTWSELFTSNATLGYTSLYPFQITSSEMPNSKKEEVLEPIVRLWHLNRKSLSSCQDESELFPLFKNI